MLQLAGQVDPEIKVAKYREEVQDAQVLRGCQNHHEWAASVEH